MGGSAIVAAAAEAARGDPRRRGQAILAARPMTSRSTTAWRVGPDRKIDCARGWLPTASRPKAAYASNKRTYSYGAHAAHVAVDPKTGHVELIDYVAGRGRRAASSIR